MNAGELVISLLLKAGGFKAQVQDAQSALAKMGDAGETGMKKTGDAAEKAGREIQDAAKRGEDSFERFRDVLMKIAGIMGGVAMIRSAAGSYLTAAAEIDRTSRSLGMNMQTLQAWQGAARSMGVEAAEVGQFFRDFNDYIVDANKFDSGPLKEIAKTLGVGLKDARGQARATEDVILDLADAFQRVGHQQATAYGMQLGLDPGMISLMQKGGSELKTLLKTQKELAVYQKHDTELTAKLSAAWQILDKRFEMGVARVMRSVVPAFQWLLEKGAAMLEWLQKNSDSALIFFSAIATVVSVAVTPALWGMATAAWAAIAPFLPLIAAVAAAALLFEDLYQYIRGGQSEWAAYWSVFGTGEEIANRLSIAWENLKTVGSALWDIVQNLVKWILNLFTLNGQGLIDSAWALWEAFSKLGNVLKNLLGYLGEKLQGLLGVVRKFLGLSSEGAQKADAVSNAAANGDPQARAAFEMASQGWGMPLRPGDLARGSGGGVDNSRRVESTTNVNGPITIQSQATDGDGVGRDLASGIRNQTAQIDAAYGR